MFFFFVFGTKRLEDVVEPWKPGVIKEVYRIWPKVVQEFRQTSPKVNVAVSDDTLGTLGIETGMGGDDFKLTKSMIAEEEDDSVVVMDGSVTDKDGSSLSLRANDSTFNLSAYFKNELNKAGNGSSSDSMSSLSLLSIPKIKMDNDVSPIDGSQKSPPSMSLLSMIEQNRNIPDYRDTVQKVTVLSSQTLIIH